MAQYYTKPQAVEAWQYNGEFPFSELPWWVADLILHHEFEYRVTGTWGRDDPLTTDQYYFDGLNWIIVSEGDWLVRYDERTIRVVSDEKFKESFEEVNAFPDPTKPIE